MIIFLDKSLVPPFIITSLVFYTFLTLFNFALIFKWALYFCSINATWFCLPSHPTYISMCFNTDEIQNMRE